MVTIATYSYPRGVFLGSLESGGLQCKGEGKLVEEGTENYSWRFLHYLSFAGQYRIHFFGAALA